AEKMFHYTPAEVIGQNVKMLMPPEYHDAHVAGFARYVKTGEARVIGIGREFTGMRKDGSTFPMEIHVSEVRHGSRRLSTGIARATPPRKLSEERTLQSERLAAIGEAMTGLAHESRNALQRSQASLERLRMRVKDLPETLELLREVQKAQDDLHRL